MASPKHLSPGDAAPPLVLASHTGTTFDLRAAPPSAHTLVVFFRFAGCPFCNVHVHVLIERHAELAKANVRVVGVFGSPMDAIKASVARQEPPFPVLADPDDAAHIAWGATHDSVIGFVDPRNVGSQFTAWQQRLPTNPGRTDGKLLRMPADFVLDADLRVRSAHYGRYAADHLSVDDVLAVR